MLPCAYPPLMQDDQVILTFQPDIRFCTVLRPKLPIDPFRAVKRVRITWPARQQPDHPYFFFGKPLSHELRVHVTSHPFTLTTNTGQEMNERTQERLLPMLKHHQPALAYAKRGNRTKTPTHPTAPHLLPSTPEAETRSDLPNHQEHLKPPHPTNDTSLPKLKIEHPSS